jgi:hypothetical protein
MVPLCTKLTQTKAKNLMNTPVSDVGKAPKLAVLLGIAM